MTADPEQDCNDDDCKECLLRPWCSAALDFPEDRDELLDAD